MGIAIIVVTSLLVMGILFYALLQLPQISACGQKKKREPAPVVEKDWKGSAERLELKAQKLDGYLQAAKNEIRERDKKIASINTSLDQLGRQYAQEKAWREKEEASILKEKAHEKELQMELNKTRLDLNSESTSRIKLEHEAKELRQIREEQGAEIRKLSTQNIELDRRVTEAENELRQLRTENKDLKRKKEGEEWVAKSDYRKLEVLHKRAIWELEQFKKQFPPSEWPQSLQPKGRSRDDASGLPESVRNTTGTPTN